jgi:hypothetical protein
MDLVYTRCKSYIVITRKTERWHSDLRTYRYRPAYSDENKAFIIEAKVFDMLLTSPPLLPNLGLWQAL